MDESLIVDQETTLKEVIKQLNDQSFISEQIQSLISKKPLFVEYDEYLFVIESLLGYPLGLSHEQVVDLFSKANGWILVQLLLDHFVFLRVLGFSRESIIVALLELDGQQLFECIKEYALFLKRLVFKSNESGDGLETDEIDTLDPLKELCFNLRALEFNQQEVVSVLAQAHGYDTLLEVAQNSDLLLQLDFFSDSLLQIAPGDEKGLLYLRQIIQNTKVWTLFDFNYSSVIALLSGESGLDYLSRIKTASRELYELGFTDEYLLYIMKDHEHLQYVDYIKKNFKHLQWLHLTADFILSVIATGQSYQHFINVMQERVIFKILKLQPNDIVILANNDEIWDNFNAVKTAYPIFKELSLTSDQIIELLKDKKYREVILSLNQVIQQLINHQFITEDFENLLSCCGGVEQIQLVLHYCSYLIDKGYTRTSLLQEFRNHINSSELSAELSFLQAVFANSLKKRKRDGFFDTAEPGPKRRIGINELSNTTHLITAEPAEDSILNIGKISLL